MTMVPQGHRPPEQEQSARAYDFDAILPINLIREHCKIDDIETVSDTTLAVYRRAALEAAEKYTGMLFTARKILRESVIMPKVRLSRGIPEYVVHKTKYLIASDVGYIYGNGPVSRIHLNVDTKTVRIPFVMTNLAVSCCDPCGDGHNGPVLQYEAGFSCESVIPSMLQLGALKYIAHVITNAGDLNKVMATSGIAQNSGYDSVGTANPALSSGAIDIWRTIVDDDI